MLHRTLELGEQLRLPLLGFLQQRQLLAFVQRALLELDPYWWAWFRQKSFKGCSSDSAAALIPPVWSPASEMARSLPDWRNLVARADVERAHLAGTISRFRSGRTTPRSCNCSSSETRSRGVDQVHKVPAPPNARSLCASSSGSPWWPAESGLLPF